MRRTERLFQIIQILRARRRPVTGRDIADELEVSLRTLYRDIAELIAQRVPVRGEAGTGYVLDPGYDMPPLTLTPDELEAAMLGAAWVAKRGDKALANGARDLIAKLTEAAPADLRPILLDGSLAPMTFKTVEPESCDMSGMRAAIRERCKVRICYQDAENRKSERTIWPMLIAYMEEVRLVAAWCELREDFRHFRTDRITLADVLEESIPGDIATLRRRWERDVMCAVS